MELEGKYSGYFIVNEYVKC